MRHKNRDTMEERQTYIVVRTSSGNGIFGTMSSNSEYKRVVKVRFGVEKGDGGLNTQGDEEEAELEWMATSGSHCSLLPPDVGR